MHDIILTGASSKSESLAKNILFLNMSFPDLGNKSMFKKVYTLVLVTISNPLLNKYRSWPTIIYNMFVWKVTFNLFEANINTKEKYFIHSRKYLLLVPS